MVFRRVWWGNLGRFSGLQCQEFLKDEVGLLLKKWVNWEVDAGWFGLLNGGL